MNVRAIESDYVVNYITMDFNSLTYRKKRVFVSVTVFLLFNRIERRTEDVKKMRGEKFW